MEAGELVEQDSTREGSTALVLDAVGEAGEGTGWQLDIDKIAQGSAQCLLDGLQPHDVDRGRAGVAVSVHRAPRQRAPAHRGAGRLGTDGALGEVWSETGEGGRLHAQSGPPARPRCALGGIEHREGHLKQPKEAGLGAVGAGGTGAQFTREGGQSDSVEVGPDVEACVYQIGILEEVEGAASPLDLHCQSVSDVQRPSEAATGPAGATGENIHSAPRGGEQANDPIRLSIVLMPHHDSIKSF